MPHWKIPVHPRIALVVPVQTFATFALSNREAEAGTKSSRAECLYGTLFYLLCSFLSSTMPLSPYCCSVLCLSPMPVSLSQAHFYFRLAKGDFPDMEFQRIPVRETYMKGFTIGSKLTCTDFLHLFGHLEREKYQMSPHTFKNVFFSSAEESP